MRICDVNNFYAPTGGGVRVYHERRIDYFAAQDEHAYALVVPGERAKIERRGATTIYEVPARPVGGAGYRVITSARALARVFADFEPDLVEIGSPYLMPLLVPRALRGRPAATVGFVHADYPDTYVRPALRGWLGGQATALARRHMAWIYGRMSATFGASEHVLGKLAALGLRRLFHTPLGVEVERFRPDRRDPALRRRLGIAEGERLLLFLGRLSGEKGIDLLIDAWPALAGRPGLRLVIAGHGPREAAVAELVARDPSIVRLDHVGGRDEVAALMASADLFLALGAFETFSLTTLEALACGTPVIAPASGGAAELIDRLGVGATFPAEEPGALAEAILAAIPPPRALLGRLRATIEAEYAWDAAIRRITRGYEDVLNAERAGERARLNAPGGWWTPAEVSAGISSLSRGGL
ncbi:MAG: glycosyltransferase [Myxococcales bacterium]|nr:glycosyltransferase [Myxococcales bacterium]